MTLPRVELLTITARQDTAQGLMLTLNGKMTANGLGELRREMDEARRRRRAVVLDMGEVTLLDRFSAEYLNSVAGPLVHFINCPVYLRPWLSVRGR